MKNELEWAIVNEHVELQEMLIIGLMNTRGKLGYFQDVELSQYRVEHAERINSVEEKLRALEQEARKYCSYKTKTKILKLKTEIGNLRKQFAGNFTNLQRQSNLLLMDLMAQEGLAPERIQQFDHFQADESLVDEQCSICMKDFEVGRNMMRLDCDGRHVFCQVCIEGWFADHNTCPICRHLF